MLYRVIRMGAFGTAGVSGQKLGLSEGVEIRLRALK
jgi:hypothetical protein